MGNIAKTLAFCKRNGIKKTILAVTERMDQIHIEQMQKWAWEYRGNISWSESLEKEALALSFQKQRDHSFLHEYLISILVPAYETNPVFLYDMIDSVAGQSYKRIELIIADASKTDKVFHVIDKYKQDNPNFTLKYIEVPENKGISENTMAALKEAEGEYIGLLDHDDVLTKDALFEVMSALQEKEYDILYSDEDKSNGDMTEFYEPNFKPDFNLDYLLCNNYICHFLVMKAELIKELGFRQEFNGAQDYDIILRGAGKLLAIENNNRNKVKQRICHIPKVLYHWRCHEDSTASNTESKRYAYEAGKAALEDFVESQGLQVTVAHTSHLGFYELKYHVDSKFKELFIKRPEVAAICGRAVKKGTVVRGPALFIKEKRITLFEGLKASYGGYMHRARMILEVDDMPKETVIWNEKYIELFKAAEEREGTLSHSRKQEIAKQNDGIFLYVPIIFKI